MAAQKIIQVQDEYYILAASALADDRSRVLKHGDSFAVLNRYGDIQPVGMGEQGLYYYYHTMAKALSAYGLDELPTKNGSVKWREQLALRLINLQKRDGSWENNNGRWFEKDPALVTSYAMLTLEMIARGLE